MTGKIALFKDVHAPHEKRLRQAQERGAIAALVIKSFKYPPGFGMYSIDGSDRKDIKIPVFESGYGYPFDPEKKKPRFQQEETQILQWLQENEEGDVPNSGGGVVVLSSGPSSSSSSSSGGGGGASSTSVWNISSNGFLCPYTKRVNLDLLTSGSYISIVPMVNEHKRALETPFQLVMSCILSIWEAAIIIFGLYRIHQLLLPPDSVYIAAAPICCTLEVIGATLRLIYTCTDPFFSYRILPDPVGQSGISVSFPFSFTAGVLLTFYCTYVSLFICISPYICPHLSFICQGALVKGGGGPSSSSSSSFPICSPMDFYCACDLTLAFFLFPLHAETNKQPKT
jgi:hypothetical protein